jgi:hypothetical protein
VFERFTEQARQVVVLAQDEARGLRHNYIGTEHILLGLLREEDGLAARALDSLDITAEKVRVQASRIVGSGEEVETGQIPFTPRAKKVLELAMREALSLGHNYIATEHILLGLARENDGVASRILMDFGVDADRIRSSVYELLGAEVPEGEEGLHPLPPNVRVGVGFHRGRRPIAFGFGSQPRGAADYAPVSVLRSFIVGWLLFAVALGLGILVGWLIWG